MYFQRSCSPLNPQPLSPFGYFLQKEKVKGILCLGLQNKHFTVFAFQDFLYCYYKIAPYFITDLFLAALTSGT